jgi:hypothetical protein
VGLYYQKDLNKLFNIYSRIESILDLKPYTLSDLVNKSINFEKSNNALHESLVKKYKCYWKSINDETKNFRINS